MSYQPQYDWSPWDYAAVIERNKPPQSVRIAVRFMLAGAAIDSLAMTVALLAYGSILHRVVWPEPITPSQLHLAEGVGWAYILFVGLARAGMWLWMASKNHAGRRWARVLSTVFFGVYTLALTYAIVRGLDGSGGQLFPAASWLVGAIAIALLWRRESGEFLAVRSRRYY